MTHSKLICVLLLAATCQAQAPSLQQVIAQIQQQMQQSIALATQSIVTQGMASIVAAIPPTPPPDPVVTLLQATPTVSLSTLYADIATCANTAGCKLLLVGWTCASPPVWAPSTAYNFGALVLDGSGNGYKLTGIATGTAYPATSGTATPFWNPKAGAITVDGPLVWTFDFAAGVKLMCTDGATQ